MILVYLLSIFMKPYPNPNDLFDFWMNNVHYLYFWMHSIGGIVDKIYLGLEDRLGQTTIVSPEQPTFEFCRNRIQLTN